MTVFLRVCVAFVKNAETEMTTVSAPFLHPSYSHLGQIFRSGIVKLSPVVSKCNIHRVPELICVSCFGVFGSLKFGCLRQLQNHKKQKIKEKQKKTSWQIITQSQ